MFIVVSYDITDDKRRKKAHAALGDFGTRVQYSVFECILEPGELKRLQERLGKIVNKRLDSVRYYQLCEADVGKVRVVGLGSVTGVESYRII
jgi:CRISPR-associated protein Cas2